MTTILTELEYRHLSGDTRSPWATSGSLVGVEDLIPFVTTQVESYLSTHLTPTRITNEEHVVDNQNSYSMGLVVAQKWLVNLDRVRLLTGSSYPISAIYYEISDTSTDRTYTATVKVVDKRLSRINVIPSQCFTGRVRVSYWSGFTGAIHNNILEAIAMLAKMRARTLIAQRGNLLEDDYPHGAPVTGMGSLGVTRYFKSPRETFFGYSHEAMEVERLLSPFVLVPTRALRL